MDLYVNTNIDVYRAICDMFVVSVPIISSYEYSTGLMTRPITGQGCTYRMCTTILCKCESQTRSGGLKITLASATRLQRLSSQNKISEFKEQHLWF